MTGAFLITLREALEAALILGIVLGYLRKLGKGNLAKYVWGGAGAALVASAIAGYLFDRLAGGFTGRAEQIFEGVVMLSAVGVLTFMLQWMQKQSRAIKGDLQAKVAGAIEEKTGRGLALLSFISVFREGVETVLFLKASLAMSGEKALFAGGLAGIAGAIIISWLLFKSTTKLDLQKFFRTTGTLLLFFAAGMFAYGIHELQEAGIIPVIIEHLWDINYIINEKGYLGSFLKALFGYNGNPSLLEVLGWVAYLGTFGIWFNRSRKAGQPH